MRRARVSSYRVSRERLWAVYYQAARELVEEMEAHVEPGSWDSRWVGSPELAAFCRQVDKRSAKP